MLRDSCHAARPDQPGLSQIGSDLSTGGSCRHPCPLRLVTGSSSIDAAGAVASCAGAPLSGRTKGVQNAPRLTSMRAQCCRVELFECSCVLAGGVLSTQASQKELSLSTTQAGAVFGPCVETDTEASTDRQTNREGEEGRAGKHHLVACDPTQWRHKRCLGDRPLALPAASITLRAEASSLSLTPR